MDNLFERVKNVIDRLRDIVKCQKCSMLKEESLMYFYHICDHFFCSDCIGDNAFCQFCKNPIDKVTCIVNDKNMLSLYQSLINFTLPSKQNIKTIFESCKQSKNNTLKIQREKSFAVKNKENGKIEFKSAKKVKASPELTNNFESPETSNKKERKPRSALRNDIDSPSTSTAANEANQKGKPTPTTTRSNRKRKPLLETNKTPLRKDELVPSISAKSRVSKVNVNKKNPKGETQLHIACKKSNITAVKELINAGADLNAKDNAGWTPLHESIFTGNIDTIKLLLDNGAKVNVPGLENTTALHEAIAKGNTKVVELLLEYGADVQAMNIFRETPLDLVNKYNFTDLREILIKSLNSPKKKIEVNDGQDEISIQNIVLYKHNLIIEDEKLVNKFVEKFNIKCVQSISAKVVPTHIIISNDKFEVTWGLISAILSGCWFITVDWVRDSLKEEKPKPAAPYELVNNRSPGAARARDLKQNHLPGLFSGCHFFFGGTFEYYNIKSLTIKREDLKHLVEQNGGVVLKRCPDPESLALEKTMPFHAQVTGSIRETSYFIIYLTEKWDPKLKYNMAHMKTLPVEWLITCIYKSELVDPKDFTGCYFL